MHLLTGGTPPSGEALKTAESGLVAKVKAAQTVFGQSWEDATLMMLRLGVKYEQIDIPNLDRTIAQVQWRNPETRDELGDATRVVQLHQEGIISTRTAQTDLGYDPEVEEENKANEATSLNEAAGRLLDAGAALTGPAAGRIISETAVEPVTVAEVA